MPYKFYIELELWTWHTSLAKQQVTSLEDDQRCALEIIAATFSMKKPVVCSLADRRVSLRNKLFRQIVVLIVYNE